MTNYTELVKALRCCATDDCGSCPYSIHEFRCATKMGEDAADAIEKLVALYEKAEMDATTLTGELAQAYAYIDGLKKDKQELQDIINEVAPW